MKHTHEELVTALKTFISSGSANGNEAMRKECLRLILCFAAAPELLEALKVTLDRYTSLINSGDCGNWDPESEVEVKAAREAIKRAES